MTRTQRIALLGLAAIGLIGLLLWFRTEVATPRPATYPWSEPLVDRDLAAIAADTLRVLVVEHPLTYERFPGDERGTEFELLERFAGQHALALKALVVPADSLLPLLQRGIGDVVAAQLHRGRFGDAVACTVPWWHVTPVLVRLRPDRAAEVAADVGDTVHVQAGGPWAMDSARAPVRRADERTGAALIEAVAVGTLPAVLVSDLEARHHAEHLPQLTFEPVDAAPVDVVLAVRRNAVRLRDALDNWLATPAEQEARALIVAAYGDRLPRRGPLGATRGRPMDGDSLSPFDALFQEKADLMHWDWELLAAIAFKESRFDTAALSVKGAQGLMQMMPATAERLGVDSMQLVEGQVHAAAIYLAMLDSLWRRSIPEADERLHFVLAAYNAGPGHVRDAQRLAQELGLDRHRWTGHVERAITLLAFPAYYRRPGITAGRCKGAQTFLYVREVLGLHRRFRSAGARGSSR
ncbi:MAG TPA: transglycosylase SLT domain-containing protein [Flavobacteriales bacterium]|nr:transglycosylase SLT domain-containing protein [Flavobacteriales bacterium]HMR28774.1 transglycosylase SLT domain-containing protein [Flavobacteriales bacterium]